MKNIYSLVSFLLFATIVTGQNIIQAPQCLLSIQNVTTNDPVSFHPSGNYENTGNREQIWTNDFSNDEDWEFTTVLGDDNWIITSTAPAILQEIASSTQSNGYALFNSYSLGTAGTEQTANIQTVSSIDCSLYSTVQVRFSQYFRRFVDSTYVLVSLDGINWSKYEVNGSIAANQYNDNDGDSNPNTQIVNITNIAANQSEVYIGFQFASNADMSQTQCGLCYAWMVDDVVLETVPDYELKLGTIFNSDYFPLATDLDVVSGPYYSIPVSQSTPIKIWTVVDNLGANPANNVTVELTLDYNGTIYGPYSSDVLNIPVGESDSVLIISYLSPDLVGSVEASLEINYEENEEASITNNTGTTNITYTEGVYALDKGGDMQLSGFDNTYGFTEWKIFNIYEITNPTYLTGVSFAMAVNTADQPDIIGTTLFIDVFEILDDGDFQYITDFGDNSLDLTLEDFSIGVVNTRTYSFEPNGIDPIFLEGDKSYGIQLTYELQDQPIFFAASGSSSYDFNGQFQGLNGPTTSNNWLLRMNIDQDGTIGIKETTQSGNLTLSQNQPNPVKDNTVISYELKNAETVTLEVYDITGKLIFTSNEGTKSAGAYTINYNASKLNAGIYTYTLVAGDARLTKKMTVIK
jgi:Secretion system C-terminal sorting domain